jgi:TetR/AcrR family transcriptional regulator, fatty acid metabolism regulator protein
MDGFTHTPQTVIDFVIKGFVQRTYVMWILRDKKRGLAEQANDLFEIVWSGINNPTMAPSADTF